MRAARSQAIFLALACLALAGCAVEPGANADPQPTASVAAPVTSAAAPDARIARFATDAPLREGMARLRLAADSVSVHASDAQVQAAAREVRAAVNSILAQCKLPPDADAALHPLLARSLAASQALEARPGDRGPSADLQAVLMSYEALFDESLRSDAGPLTDGG
jgi:hypothetical protein